MRNQGRKGSKRKAETNFEDAYSGASALAPPPASRDVLAVPAKLRKIMQLKSLLAGGARQDGQADPRPGKGFEKKTNKVGTKKPPGGKTVKGLGEKNIEERSSGTATQLPAGTADQPSERKKGLFASKWKKGEQELKRLVEKLDRREKLGIKHGLSERRKIFLKEKKKRGEGIVLETEREPSLNQYDKVEFGDIVQAPPNLSFPRKAAAVKEKVKLQGYQAVMMEKMRSEAIESYRRRKESSSLGGQQLRVLNFAARGS